MDVEIELTPDHPILGETAGRKHALRYREVGKLKLGDYIRFFLNPVSQQENVDYLKGWLTGYTEGDGSFYNRKFYPKKRQARRQFKAASIDKEIRIALKLRAAKFGITLTSAKCHSSQNGYSKGRTYDGVAAYQYEVAETLEQLCQYNLNDTKDFHRGYLAGIFDAEGTIVDNVNPEVWICQKREIHPEIVNHIINSLEQLGFFYVIENTQVRLHGGTLATLKFLIETRPVLQRKTSKFFNGHTFRNFATLEITAIQENQKEKKVFNLETETQNYIANGFILHNCCGIRREGRPGKDCPWREAARAALHISDDLYVQKEVVVWQLLAATERSEEWIEENAANLPTWQTK